ncbi:MAG: 16S rRNA (adenine(1518)-N(6)/adenine(1519)-N(6))-dimethyltransferase RsmA [Bacteroidia bacterium]
MHQLAGMYVRAKKHLGQHFLNDQNIAQNIVLALINQNCPQTILEVGPGTGVLTKFLLQYPEKQIFVSEIDTESIEYLKLHYVALGSNIINQSFLEIDFSVFGSNQIAVIGNFPYNISSQIVFKILDNWQQVPIMVGMFQKEVAMRLCAKPKTKDYGILTVLAQAFYDIEYLFTVPAHLFTPPPKVLSAVVRFTLKNSLPDCDYEILRKVVKTAFNQRRKKLRNALSVFGISDEYLQPFLNQRAEELSLQDFITLTNLIKQNSNGNKAG